MLRAGPDRVGSSSHAPTAVVRGGNLVPEVNALRRRLSGGLSSDGDPTGHREKVSRRRNRSEAGAADGAERLATLLPAGRSASPRRQVQGSRGRVFEGGIVEHYSACGNPSTAGRCLSQTTAVRSSLH